MNIGKVVRTIREERGLTQEQLARACKRSSGYIAKLEQWTPAYRNPTIKTISKIASVLGVPVEALISERKAA